MEHQGKIAVVTGASTGIGKATAEKLGALGALVVLVARSQDKLEAIRADIESRGGKALVQVTDLRSVPEMEAMGARVAELGGADLVVCSAGAWHDKEQSFKGPPLEETRADQIDLLFDVELRATLHTCRVLLPAMKKAGRRGRIVTLSCGFAGPHEAKGWVPYYVANMGVSALTAGLAAELRELDIAVNAVAPRFVRSEAVLQFFPDEAKTAIEPGDVANLILFLLSSAAEHVSGQTIEVRSWRDV